MDEVGFATFIKVGRAEFTIRLTFFEHMIERFENVMGYSNNSTLAASSGRQAMIERSVIGVFDLDRRPRHLHQSTAQPTIAMTDGAGIAFACTFVVAWTDFGPTS